MASGNASRVKFTPGRLVVNPTEDFATGTFPYGGTEVGYANAGRVAFLGSPFEVEYESLGETGEVLEAKNKHVFGCFLRGHDDDAVEQFLSGGYSEGAQTRHAVYSVPGDRSPGMRGTSRAIVLAYVPDDLVHSNGLLIYHGVPDWDEAAEVALQRRAETGIPLIVRCLRDANGNTLRWGRMADLTYT